MENIDAKVSKQGILTLKIDLSKKGVESKSGKTRVVASTRGNAVVPEHDDMRMGVNVYRYKESK